MSKFFLIPPDVLQNSSDPPLPQNHHLIIKAAKLVSVFKAEIDHPLGLLEVKAGNLRWILIVVQVKLQNSHHINILYTTGKKFRRQLPFIPSYFSCYGKQVTMATEEYFHISAVWCWYRGNSWLEKQFLCMVVRVNKLPWQQDESLYLSHFEK